MLRSVRKYIYISNISNTIMKNSQCYFGENKNLFYSPRGIKENIQWTRKDFVIFFTSFMIVFRSIIDLPPACLTICSSRLFMHPRSVQPEIIKLFYNYTIKEGLVCHVSLILQGKCFKPDGIKKQKCPAWLKYTERLTIISKSLICISKHSGNYSFYSL